MIFFNKVQGRRSFDNAVASVITIHLFFMICKNMLVSTNAFFLSINNSLNILSFALIGISYGFLIIKRNLLSKINLKIYLILFLILVFWGVSFLIDPIRITSNDFPYSYVRIQMRSFLAYCLPLFVLVSCLSDYELLLRKLYKYNIIPFIFSAVTFVFSLKGDVGSYSMSYGYAVLLTCTIALFKFRRYHNFLNILQFLFCAIFIAISGSRGPLICVLAAAVCAFLYGTLNVKKVIIAIIFILASVIVIINLNQIIDYLSSILNRFGYSSRTLQMFNNGNLFYSKERVAIHDTIFKALNEGGWAFGLGAFGGEALVGLAHGLFIDIYANFGYVFGTILLCWVAISCIKSIAFEKINPYSELMLILVVVGFPIGFFGSEFWVSKEFWMVLALIISRKSQIKIPIRDSAFETKKQFSVSEPMKL